MSPDPGRPFAVEPWLVREPRLDMAAIGQVESVFALSNGHIGLRGNLDEGEPHATPGTYLNSFYEKRPLPYAEGGYGYPESGQTIINVTNGKLIRLLVEDEPFDLRYEVEVLDAPALLVVQSELVANEQLPARDEADPRVEAALTDPLLSEQHGTHDNGAWLIHQTRQSGLRVAAAMDHEVEGPAKLKVTSEATEDIGRTTVITRLQPGERLTIVKYLAYGWSSRRSLPAGTDQVRAGLAAARYTGWQGLLDEQRAYLDEFWTTADVEIDGDAELQQAVRVATWHVLQAGTLTRQVEWESPAGRVVKLCSTRLVSLTQRAIAAISYEVEVIGEPALLVVQSELVANGQLPSRGDDGPRVEAALTDPLVAEQHRSDETGATLIHQTRRSGLRVAAAMDHEVSGPNGFKVTSESTEDIGRTTIITRLAPGEKLKVVKYVAYGWSASEATEDIGRTTVITRLQPGETLTIVKYLAYGWSSRRSQPALHD